jgi:DUF971 family protein
VEAPKSITKANEETLKIVWQNGQETILSAKTLRDNCPAADSRVNRGELNHDAPLTTPLGSKKKGLLVVKHSLEESYKIVEIWSVGRYAIGIRYGDGHRSGIYTFEQLKGLTPISALSQNLPK